MELERWHRVDNILQAALALNPPERSVFVDSACEGDEALRDEVISLLSLEEEGLDIIDTPAVEAAACVLAPDQPDLIEGQLVGHYRILSLLGVGGMGEVYLAEDTKLSRKIALKLLPADSTRDPDRVRRFQQEARAASALNHPSILTIYEIGEIDDKHFIATEFIDGETLRRLISRTQLSIEEALDISIQVASALSTAHLAEIIHRDIKPENIMIRKDGLVKVLDFGLAKLAERQVTVEDPKVPSAIVEEIREGTPAGKIRAENSESTETGAGLLMGTLPYMSPEQVSGQKLDPRTDIFSLGVVTYEMVSGRLPFDRKTNGELAHSIFEKDPEPLSRDLSDEAGQLQRIVEKALCTDRDKRYQTSGELLAELSSLKQQLGLRLPTPPHVTWIKQHSTGVVLATLIVGLASLIFGLSRILHKPSARFSDLSVTRLTSSGSANIPAISPDGKYVVYGSAEGTARSSLWLREVDSASETQIAPAEKQYIRFAFSPDGRNLYYSGNLPDDLWSSFYQLPIPGGPEIKLPTKGVIAFSFSPDGQRIAFSRNKQALGETIIVTVNADGTDEQEIVKRHAPSYFPNQTISWSPDGRFIACVGNSAGEGYPRVIEVNVQERTERPITSQRWQNISGIAWLPDMSGMILAASEERSSFQQIWYVSYPSGEARKLTNDVNSYQSISLTADGKAFVTRQVENESRIWVMPVGENSSSPQSTDNISVDTASARQISSGRFDGASGLSWTPDGRIVFTSEASGNLDLWIMDGDGGNRKQLTTDSHNDISPSVSPDGRFVVFTSNRTGADHIWRMDIDGGNLKLLTNSHVERLPDCTPDGKWVAFNSFESGKATIWKVPIDGGQAVQVTDAQSLSPRTSPDGKLIAYDSVAPQPRIGVMDANGSPVQEFDVQRAKLRGPIQWILNGRALAGRALLNGVVNIRLLPLDGQPQKQLTDFKSNDVSHHEFSKDGKRLACVRVNQTADVILVRLK